MQKTKPKLRLDGPHLLYGNIHIATSHDGPNLLKLIKDPKIIEEWYEKNQRDLERQRAEKR